MNKKWRERELILTIIVSVCVILLGIFVAVQEAKGEPFPEHMKNHSQAFECYTVTVIDGIEHKGDEWIVNWRMATEWFPDAEEPYIVFTGRRRTVLPTPPEYSCTVWYPPKPKKEEKK